MISRKQTLNGAKEASTIGRPLAEFRPTLKKSLMKHVQSFIDCHIDRFGSKAFAIKAATIDDLMVLGATLREPNEVFALALLTRSKTPSRPAFFLALSSVTSRCLVSVTQ